MIPARQKEKALSAVKRFFVINTIGYPKRAKIECTVHIGIVG